jgi:BCD family chlorophyll transporter-like MFS transporter
LTPAPLGWLGIVRLGLVQAGIGAVVVLTTATLNRVMVVELALAAAVPGTLVALHHAVQILRPKFGHGSDVGGRRTPWIIGGTAVLACGGLLAAVATAWTAEARLPGLALAVFAFLMIGAGGAAAGTSLLALTAARVAPERRPAAAAVVWLMMIAGFVVTAAVAGAMLDPFTTTRLVAVAAGVAVGAFVVASVAVWGLEGPKAVPRATTDAPPPAFRAAMAQIWAEPEARRFTLFVFVAMLAYSLQDLILEPFAGLVFGLTPGESTRLASFQYGGVLIGMIAVALIGNRGLAPRGWMRRWTIGGCVASGAALAALALGGVIGEGFPLRPAVFTLGLANGVFAVAAIGSMMVLAGNGGGGREGVKLGLWGASQAIASALGGFLGTVFVDLARFAFGSAVAAYGTVFAVEAALFLAAAVLAARVAAAPTPGGGGPATLPVNPQRGALAADIGGG